MEVGFGEGGVGESCAQGEEGVEGAEEVGEVDSFFGEGWAVEGWVESGVVTAVEEGGTTAAGAAGWSGWGGLEVCAWGRGGGGGGGG